jgi:hypothetical protein
MKLPSEFDVGDYLGQECSDYSNDTKIREITR